MYDLLLLIKGKHQSLVLTSEFSPGLLSLLIHPSKTREYQFCNTCESSLPSVPPSRQQLHLRAQEERKGPLTLRLFISRACVRRPSSFSPVPILLCSKCSFSSSLRTTCSWASTLESEAEGTEGMNACSVGLQSCHSSCRLKLPLLPPHQGAHL